MHIPVSNKTDFAFLPLKPPAFYLGVKDHTSNPWDTFMSTYKVGDVANVRIVKLMTFGAFAEVVPGVDGLIHISQIAEIPRLGPLVPKIRPPRYGILPRYLPR